MEITISVCMCGEPYDSVTVDTSEIKTASGRFDYFWYFTKGILKNCYPYQVTIGKHTDYSLEQMVKFCKRINGHIGFLND